MVWSNSRKERPEILFPGSEIRPSEAKCFSETLSVGKKDWRKPGWLQEKKKYSISEERNRISRRRWQNVSIISGSLTMKNVSSISCETVPNYRMKKKSLLTKLREHRKQEKRAKQTVAQNFTGTPSTVIFTSSFSGCVRETICADIGADVFKFMDQKLLDRLLASDTDVSIE